MIPNIVRGSDPAGLVRYLFGKGRRNEHTDQHLVCASGDMFPSFDMDGKPAASYAEIGRRFDRRYRVRERKDDPFPPDMRGKNNPEREHGRKRVWHCSLAIKAGQGILTDQEWEAVIRDYLTRMNIIDGDDDQGVTWLAVRHGLSANGNDHVHIMVQLAADDGWINPYHDRINAQKSCRRMEKTRPELVELARSDTGTRVSWQYGQWRQWAEWKARNEYGDDEGWDALDGNERSRLVTAVAASTMPRQYIARIVEACAKASHSEDEFIRRAQGRLLHRPQAAQGNRQRLVHRPRPGGRLQDHVAQHGRVDGTVQRLRARRRHAIETTARRLGGRCQKPQPRRAGMARRDGEPPALPR